LSRQAVTSHGIQVQDARRALRGVVGELHARVADDRQAPVQRVVDRHEQEVLGEDVHALQAATRIGYSGSYLACRIGRLGPISPPCVSRTRRSPHAPSPQPIWLATRCQRSDGEGSAPTMHTSPVGGSARIGSEARPLLASPHYRFLDRGLEGI
jgi:hypothetical protein